MNRKKVAALEGHSSDDSDFVAGLSCKKRERRFVLATVNGVSRNFLVDSGSDITVVEKSVAKQLKLRYSPCSHNTRSIGDQSVNIVGSVVESVTVNGHAFQETVYIASKLCDPAILGSSALCQFKSVTIKYKGEAPPLVIASNPLKSDKVQNCMNMEPFPIVTLQKDAVPIRCASRFRSTEDQIFIREEIKRLREAGVIEESQSPWRAQVVVSKTANHRKRLCIDYASTVNRFTIPDGYPIPIIEQLLLKVSTWKWFSYIDLKSAYHQLLLLDGEKPLTAFEADNKLWQFTRLPFGVTNGVPAFQRAIDIVIDGLSGAVADIDDVVIGGATEAEHDRNLAAFRARARKYNLTFNEKKSKFKVRDLKFLGHRFLDGKMLPDETRLEPILGYPVPTTLKELDRFVGMSVHHSKWVQNFAIVAEPLFRAKKDKKLPLSEEAIKSISAIKEAIANAVLWIPDRNIPFVLETDASGGAVGGILSQNGRPVAFLSHKLSEQELNWSSIEKEAYAIVWSVQKCRRYLLGSKFSILTDQQGVSYLFDSRPKSSVKNSKLCRWRLVLSEYNFDVQYRPGKCNAAADALSRISALCADIESQGDEPDIGMKKYFGGDVDFILAEVHDKMGHPGIARTAEFIQRLFDIPNLKQKVQDYISKCPVCLELKPKFFKPPYEPLVSSKTPWERLSLDFVGPKKRSSAGNQYFLTVVDEFSRFPFAFAVKEANVKSVISALSQLFSIFGPPSSVHSDRGSVFESAEFKLFLDRWNVKKTRTTTYNPAGNGQCERLNGIIWKTVKLRLRQQSKPAEKWDEEIPMALSNIRGLGSRALKFECPHNRLFGFSRRSTLQTSKRDDQDIVQHPVSESVTPNWLRNGQDIYVKNFRKAAKDDPLVQPARLVRLLSPHHALVSYPHSNRTDTVATKYLSKREEAKDDDVPVTPGCHLDEIPISSQAPSID